MTKIIKCKKNKIFNKLSVYVFSVASALFTGEYIYCSNGKNNINNVNNGINTSNILNNLNINSIINDFDLKEQNKNSQINSNNNILNNPIFNNLILNSQINPNNNILNNPILNNQINPANNILNNLILNNQINPNNNILNNLILNNLILNSQINPTINNMLNFNDNILRKPCIQNKLNINNNINHNNNILNNNNNNSNLINSLSYNLFTRRENDFFDEFRRTNMIQKSNNVNYENLINYNSNQSSDFIKKKPKKTKKIKSLLGRKRENTNKVDVKKTKKKHSRFLQRSKFTKIKTIFFDYLVEIINKIIEEEVGSKTANSICDKIVKDYEASKSENEKDQNFKYRVRNKRYICRIRKDTIKNSDGKNFLNLLNMTVLDLLTENTIVEYHGHRDKNFNKNFLNELYMKKCNGELNIEKLDEILNLKLIVCFSHFAGDDLIGVDSINEKSSDVLNEYMKPFNKYYTNYCFYREKDVDSEYINALQESLLKLIIDYKLKDFFSN